jgi:DNA-binding beta-propeller fold protein YncE
MKRSPTFRVLLLAASFAVVAGAGTVSQGSKLAYKLALDPLKLPAGLALGEVTGLGVDSMDNLFVLRHERPFVLVFDKTGKHLRSWNGDFKTPHGLRIDAKDHVWIADVGNHLVRKFAADGKLLLTLGTKNRPGVTQRRFDQPADAIAGADGAVYVADGYGNSRIVKFSEAGKFVREWGKEGDAEGQFDIPHAVAWDPAGKLYVGDRENSRVQIFDGDGKHLATWKNVGFPYGLYRRDDKTYLADGETGEIRILDKDGTTLTSWNARQGTEDRPHALCVDSAGHIYVGFVTGKKLQKWTKETP